MGDDMEKKGQQGSMDKASRAVSTDNRVASRDRANRAANPVNTSQRRAAKGRLKPKKTTRTATVSVVLRSSFFTLMYWKSRPRMGSGTSFLA